MLDGHGRRSDDERRSTGSGSHEHDPSRHGSVRPDEGAQGKSFPRLWRSALEEAAGRTSEVGEPGGARPLLSLLAELDELATEISEATRDEIDGHAAAEALVRSHKALDRIRAVQLGWLGRAESDGAWLGTGARSIGAWVARALDVTFHEARGLVRTARAWRDVLPGTAAAARAGTVSTAKGALIAATATTPHRIDALTTPVGDDPDARPNQDASDESCDCASAEGPCQDTSCSRASSSQTGEQVLLDLACGYGINEFRRLTRRFSHVADPDADERGYRAALDREHFDMAATTGGYHLSGFLTTDHGQILKTALRAVRGVPAAGDTRTSGQQRAAALTNLGQLVLDKGLTGKVGTVRPHLSVHVGFTELEELLRRRTDPRGHGPAYQNPAGPNLRRLVTEPPAEWEDRAGPIPRAVLRRLAADSEVARVVFGPDSQVIDVGRSQRTFAGHLRRAVVARDRSCVVDDCGAPPSIGQIHHATTRWADGGHTSVTDGALVCGFHNRWLEDARVPMRWLVDADGHGRWQLGSPGTYAPDGSGHFPPTGSSPPSGRGARERPDTSDPQADHPGSQEHDGPDPPENTDTS